MKIRLHSFMVAITLIFTLPFPIPSKGKLVGRLLHYLHELSFLLFCIYLFIIYLFMLCVSVCTCVGVYVLHMHVEDRGQLAPISCSLTSIYTLWHTPNCPLQVNKLIIVIMYFFKDCEDTVTHNGVFFCCFNN